MCLAVSNLCPHTARPCDICGILADFCVSYFHMDELYSTISVYQEPKTVLTLKIEFSLSSCFSFSVFKGDLLFFMAVTMGLLFTSPRRAVLRY